jgi:hypothetical protein
LGKGILVYQKLIECLILGDCRDYLMTKWKIIGDDTIFIKVAASAYFSGVYRR